MIGNGEESRVLELVTARPWRRRALEAVAALDLPDGWIGAGFLRAPVWDHLHGYQRPTPLADIDVIYFDPEHREPEAERAHEARLAALAPGLPWSVRNQARMHERNGDRPYESTEDALKHWLETPTAVAVRLRAAGRPALLAPFGLDDLLGLIMRPTPHARGRPDRLAAYRRRVETKNWLAAWPKVRVLWE
jgi:hypothetical protein